MAASVISFTSKRRLSDQTFPLREECVLCRIYIRFASFRMAFYDARYGALTYGSPNLPYLFKVAKRRREPWSSGKSAFPSLFNASRNPDFDSLRDESSHAYVTRTNLKRKKIFRSGKDRRFFRGQKSGFVRRAPCRIEVYIE